MRNNITHPAFYFLHIPKTAGTSIHNWIVGKWSGVFCPDMLWSQLLLRPKEDLNQFNFFFGHFYTHLSQYLDRDLRVLTFLRNPLDRAVSHFEHIKRDPNHYFHKALHQKSSFLDFLHDPILGSMLCNFQVKSLSTDLDTSKFHTINVGEDFSKFSLEKYIETQNFTLTDSSALEKAKNFLRKCEFVGVVEDMPESMNRMGKIIKYKHSEDLLRLNENPKISLLSSLTKFERSELSKKLEQDWELYKFAIEQFNYSV